MAEGGGGSPTDNTPLVWLLGNRHPNADRSISWDGEIPNLSDPDVLIVDMTTLGEKVLARVDKSGFIRAQSSLMDKLMNHGIIVVITQPHFTAASSSSKHTYSNYYVVPALISTKNVQAGHRIVAGDTHPFKPYIDSIKHFTFHIDNWKARMAPDPERNIREYALVSQGESEVTDNAGHILGVALRVAQVNYSYTEQPVKNAGQLVLLPPPTEPIEDALDRILAVYGKTSDQETPPSWAEGIPLGPAPKIEEEIADLEKDKAAIQEQIEAKRVELGSITAHRRLLYSGGAELEEAVADAFQLLGFAEASRAGGADSADVVLDMTAAGYAMGLVEAKGTCRRTGLEHIVQCNKWKDEAAKARGMLSKGVFVPNQHRKSKYPESSGDRIHFEDNELRYAELNDICIIPSCVLFEAVKAVLGGAEPDRGEIEAAIAGARCVLGRIPVGGE